MMLERELLLKVLTHLLNRRDRQHHRLHHQAPFMLMAIIGKMEPTFGLIQEALRGGGHNNGLEISQEYKNTAGNSPEFWKARPH